MKNGTSFYGGSAEEAGWHQRAGHLSRIMVSGEIVWQDVEYLNQCVCLGCGEIGTDCRCNLQMDEPPREEKEND